MAILKHIAIRNADYSDAQCYLMYEHNKDTNKPILDENDDLIPRKGLLMDGINCDPFIFDLECKELNAIYNKNNTYKEIKAHHYIISFDPKDVTEYGLTVERAQQLGLEYTNKNFPGHQAIVCTHQDGHNKSGNIHIHIVINSLRKNDVEHQDFMERPCDSYAGYKHHLSTNYLIHLKKSLMDICIRERLHQVDLLTPAKKRITDREYYAKDRGQKKLNERNKQILADGLIPRKTEFQTQKDFLRDAIDDAAACSCSQEEFKKILLDKYNIFFKLSRGRFSYLHPERNKYITGKMLGTHYQKDYLLKFFENNAEKMKVQEQETIVESADTKTKSLVGLETPSAYVKPSLIHFIKSDLRLVISLQNCLKAQQNIAYANKVKISNLKEMAKTVAYIQEHGYDTKDSLENSFSEIKSQAATSRKNLKIIEDKLQQINKQIHYTGQYLANKSTYQQFCKSKDKGQFRKEYSTEIALYESARKFLKEHSTDSKLPSMNLLKAEKEQLLLKKVEAQKKYHYYRDYQKELYTVCSNVDMILDQENNRKLEQQKSADTL